MTKKKVSEVNKEQDEKEKKETQAFIDDIKAVEVEHGRQVIPMIQYTDQGLYPILGQRKTPEKQEVPEVKAE